ncbi:TetR/AcrR family transcriptional regulator [Streptomyces sp. NPDC006879]|uniref:TetR/AcrR family transcriptional regulator n=1 Tax=Streptomyces sp. NPDC006879 TaxID=3364767 RepID=UPI0036B9CE24
MPTARESLLDAAHLAIAAHSWPKVRMVEVAAVAGVSRQTLYNEFGGKDGLARALVRRETDMFLRGVDQALAAAEHPREQMTAVVEWTVRAARAHPLVRALLTGCWDSRLPTPQPVRPHAPALVPAQRRADAGVPSPTELSLAVRDRLAHALNCGQDGLRHCELVVRLALSYVVAPPGGGATEEGMGEGAFRVLFGPWDGEATDHCADPES